MKHVKSQLPVIGIDDGPFLFGEGNLATIVGVVMKGISNIDAILTQTIYVDSPSNQVTNKIAQMINESRHREQLRVIFLDGLTFGGFGVIDLDLLFLKTEIPIIAIVDHLPDFERMKTVLLNHFTDGRDRWRIIKKNILKPVTISNKQIYIQFKGISFEIAQEIIQKTIRLQNTRPEALRLAHMIAASMDKNFHDRVKYHDLKN